MAAASKSARRGRRATVDWPVIAATMNAFALNNDVFDRRCEELGATSEKDKAELVKTDRKGLWRYRKHKITPSVEIAIWWAERLDLTVEELWGGRAA